MFSLEETYNQAIRTLRNIVEDIRFGRKLNFNPANMCSIQICKYLNDDTNILTFLIKDIDFEQLIYMEELGLIGKKF